MKKRKWPKNTPGNQKLVQLEHAYDPTGSQPRKGPAWFTPVWVLLQSGNAHETNIRKNANES